SPAVRSITLEPAGCFRASQDGLRPSGAHITRARTPRARTLAPRHLRVARRCVCGAEGPRLRPQNHRRLPMKLTSVIPLSLALAFAGLAPAAVPAPAAAGIPLLHPASKDDKAAPLVDLNSASKPELVKLPGLGETAAD